MINCIFIVIMDIIEKLIGRENCIRHQLSLHSRAHAVSVENGVIRGELRNWSFRLMSV